MLNIPHRIVKMWWEGNTLHGTLEIITSPGYTTSGIVSMPGDYVIEYLKRGVRLGISSRGLGSVKKVKDENIVQSDFELLCFDLVINPSTPGAYLYTENPKTTFSESSTSDKKVIQNSNNESNTNDSKRVLDRFIKKFSH
jgi:hypothetical protein